MNIEVSRNEGDRSDPGAATPANPEGKPRRAGTGLALLALLVALVALAGTAWLWRQGTVASQAGAESQSAEVARLDRRDAQLSAQLQEFRDALDSVASADREERILELQSGLAEERSRLDSLGRSLEEQAALSRSLQSATDAMHGRLLAAEAALAEERARAPDVRGELDLAEVDYLLRLAIERLQLFADPRAAGRALDLADRQLEAMDNPAYVGVRQAIAAAQRELAATDAPDESGIAARLDSIQQAIPELAFRTAKPAAPAPGPGAEAGWWEKLKSTFAGLVTVRRSTAEDDLRLSLADRDFIRQRLWLQVEIARLALMRRDQPAFRDALARLQTSLADWFDPSDGEVRSAGVAAADLATLDITATWPDISAPWSTLRAIRPGQLPGGGAATGTVAPGTDRAAGAAPDRPTAAHEPETAGEDGR